MNLSSVGAALDVLTKASKALDSVREQAKTSHDTALKENISKLYDDFLDLKALILRLTEENQTLKAAQQNKPPEPRSVQRGLTSYYYVGEDGPFCQRCYDSDGKFSRLMPLQEYALGTGRKCEVCDKVFFEKTSSAVTDSRSTGIWS